MKRFLALILAGLMVASVATTAMAQGAGPRTGGGQQSGGQRNGGGTNYVRIDEKTMDAIRARVVASLGLTAAQKNAVAAADKKNKAAMEKLRKANGNKNFSDMSQAERTKIREANQKQRAAYDAELKKAMGAKFATYQTKLRTEFEKEMSKRGGMAMNRSMDMVNAVHNRVVAGLGLTAAQKQGVAAADKKYKDSITALQKQMAGKDFRSMSEGERKKYSDAMNKARTAREASLKKAMGAKYATYQTKMQAEMKKEMEKRNPGRTSTPPKPGGGRGA